MSAEERVSTLLGNPRKAIIAMAIPLIVSLLVGEVNTVADRAWCSGLGVDPVSAISVVRPIYNTVVGLGSGLGIGAAAVISRMIGARRKGDSEIGAVQSLIVSVAFGLVLTPVMFFFQQPLLEALGASDVMSLAMDYMTVYTLSTVLIIINGTVGGILTGQGSAVYATAMMATLAISNMVLDPVLIYVLGLGIVGASAATVLATVLSLTVGTVLMLSKKTYLDVLKTPKRVDRARMRSVLAAGVPVMAENTVIYFMDAVLNAVVIFYAGTDGLAMFSTPDSIIMIIIVPAVAIGSALVTVASSAYGQKDAERMKSAFKYAFIYGIASVVALSVVTEVFTDQILFLFTYSEEMAALKPEMVHFLRILCFYAPLYSFNPICSGFIQAMAHPNRSVACSLIRNFILIVFFAIAGMFSLEAIVISLDLGHACGAALIAVVAFVTFRQMRREGFPSLK